MSLSEVEPLGPELEAIAADLGLTLESKTADTLLKYMALLQRWNRTYNLTSVREPAAMLTQHLADCLATIAPLRRESRGRSQRLLDVGSGGGLPGAVIAMWMPELHVSCVDAVGKKAAFVRQVATELRIPNLEGLHARVESIRSASFDLVTSRAFASLGDFARLTAAAIAPGGLWMAMKGRTPVDEIAHLPADVEVFHVEQLEVPGLMAKRCLVWLRQTHASAETRSL